MWSRIYMYGFMRRQFGSRIEMDVSSLQALYAEICRAPRVLIEADPSLLARFYDALRDFLWLTARRLVRGSVDNPLLVSY